MSQIDRDYSEKRDFIRMGVDAKAFLKVAGQSIPVLCRDLSSTGMQLRAPTNLNVGDKVSVHLPSHHESLKGLDVEAEVIRVDKAGEGLQVLGLAILQMD